MQGKVVWDILQRDKVYYADKALLREDNYYSKDIKRLNGLYLFGVIVGQI